MIHGVLLDVDGTLVLSNDAHALAWVEAMAHHGYKVDFNETKKLIGMGGDKLIPALAPNLESASGPGKKISEFRSKLFLEKYAPALQPAPGSRALVQKLIDEGFKLMIASSAQSHELETLLKAAEVNDLLQAATTSSDADESKPDPDIIGAALDRINLSAPQVLMVGDTPYDIEAAAQCAIKTVAVRCGGWNDQNLKGAAAIYSDPSDIVAHYDSSPFKR